MHTRERREKRERESACKAFYFRDISDTFIIRCTVRSAWEEIGANAILKGFNKVFIKSRAVTVFLFRKNIPRILKSAGTTQKVAVDDNSAPIPSYKPINGVYTPAST